MQNEKLLTISIASYNVEKCLAYCLDSLILKNENLKLLDIIIVNDGSKDGTLSVAKKYIDMFPDVFRVVDKENGGYGSTINSSIAIAKGKYYKLLDADDLFDTEGLNDLLEYIKNNKDDVDLIITPYIKNFTDINEQIVVNDIEGTINCREVELDTFKNIPAMHSMCVRTECIKNIHIQEHCFYTDNEYVAYVLLNAQSVSSIESDVYIYNLGLNDQSVSLNGLRKHLDDWEKVYLGLKEMLHKNTPSNKKTIIYLMQKEIVYSMYLAYLVQEDLLKHKENIVKIDKEIKLNDNYVYTITNDIFLIKYLRLVNFHFYKVFSKLAMRRLCHE